MKIEWKTSKKLKPEVILKRLDNIKTVTAEGNVSFSSFDYHDAVAALQTMIHYPEDIAWMTREIFLSKAISEAAKNGVLDRDNVISELNILLRGKLKQKERVYYTLTSISVAPATLLNKVINIGACKIKIIGGGYPKKFNSRNALVAELKNRGFDNRIEPNPSGYSNVIISIKSKSVDWAASDCLKALDILRAVWSLSFNSSMEFIGDEWSPINKIRLGGVHTVHNEDGSLAFETFWYEPNFVSASPIKLSSSSIEKLKYCSNFLGLIEKSKYSNAIKSALLRYVRALDERDQNSALIRLWGAMEELLSPNGANYDLVTKRCAFLFKDHGYHRQLLEHLREYRNTSVHAGELNEKVKTLCFQLQFYFYHLIVFHLSNVRFFDNLDQANEFLDSSLDVNLLKKRKKMIVKAIKFVTPAKEK